VRHDITKTGMPNKNFAPELGLSSDQQERFDFLDTQARHEQELDSLGILDKARSESLSEFALSMINNLTRTTIHLETSTDEDGNRKQTAKMRFATPHLEPDGTYTCYSVSVDVVYNYPELESMDLANEFTLQQAEAVLKMVEELQSAVDDGTYPNLSSTLSYIPGEVPISNTTEADTSVISKLEPSH